MSNNLGTLVVSPIRPHSSDDFFPTAFSNEIKGGYKTFTTVEERNLLPAERRQLGEMCYITEQEAFYVLIGGIENSNWSLLSLDGGSDKYFSQIFTDQSIVTVTHNLGKYPAVTITDSANDEVIAEIKHLSLNQFTVTFSSAFSGQIICN